MGVERVLEAPRELIHDQAFNVGRMEDNVQVRDVAELVRDAVPDSKLTFADGAGPDLRNYRVDFAKLTDTFPGLKMAWRVRRFRCGCTKERSRLPIRQRHSQNTL